MANDDLISRKAAIDAICEHGVDLERRGITVIAVVNHKQATVDLLENLPSAQPEIIRCKDCKHYNAGFECLIEGYGIERDKDWFCADAKRRTDE